MRVQGLKKIVTSGNSFLRDFSIGIRCYQSLKYAENAKFIGLDLKNKHS